MLTVKKTAGLANITTDTLRYYVKIGLIIPTRNRKNNYKQFTNKDIKQLKFIKRAQQLGFSLADIRQLLHDARKGTSPCPKARKIIAERIEENQQTLAELQQLLTTMERALNKWNTMQNQAPSGKTICHLIEDWDIE